MMHDCMVQIDLETKLDVQRELNVFKYNPDFEQAQAEWAAIRKEILGEASEEDGSEDDDEDDESEDDAAAAGGNIDGPATNKPTQVRNHYLASSLPPTQHRLLRHALSKFLCPKCAVATEHPAFMAWNHTAVRRPVWRASFLSALLSAMLHAV
jgi:hypothetical protein